MLSIDLLIQCCIYLDYPIFRLHLQRYRDRFQKIILYPSDHNRELSFKPFLYEQIKETWIKDHTIDWTTPSIDWRQAETEPMLPYSDAEWIYFTEPDWFIKDHTKFYDTVEKAMATADAIGWWNPTNYPYLHPACFFIKREVLEKTQKDFRAHPEINGCDHFAMLTRDLEKLGAKIVTLQDLGFNCEVVPEADCFHLGGITSNIIDSVVNPNFVFHRPDIFYIYNYWSRQVSLPRRMEYLALSSKVEAILKEKHPEALSASIPSPWATFFK